MGMADGDDAAMGAGLFVKAHKLALDGRSRFVIVEENVSCPGQQPRLAREFLRLRIGGGARIEEEKLARRKLAHDRKQRLARSGEATAHMVVGAVVIGDAR